MRQQQTDRQIDSQTVDHFSGIQRSSAFAERPQRRESHQHQHQSIKLWHLRRPLNLQIDLNEREKHTENTRHENAMKAAGCETNENKLQQMITGLDLANLELRTLNHQQNNSYSY